MIAGRLIGLLVAALVGMAGCGSTGAGDGRVAPPRDTAPLLADPSQIFGDVPQNP